MYPTPAPPREVLTLSLRTPLHTAYSPPVCSTTFRSQLGPSASTSFLTHSLTHSLLISDSYTVSSRLSIRTGPADCLCSPFHVFQAILIHSHNHLSYYPTIAYKPESFLCRVIHGAISPPRVTRHHCARIPAAVFLGCALIPVYMYLLTLTAFRFVFIACQLATQAVGRHLHPPSYRVFNQTIFICLI
jgi:hypothetical protein